MQQNGLNKDNGWVKYLEKVERDLREKESYPVRVKKAVKSFFTWAGEVLTSRIRRDSKVVKIKTHNRRKQRSNAQVQAIMRQHGEVK